MTATFKVRAEVPGDNLTLGDAFDALLARTAELVRDGTRSGATLAMQHDHRRYLEGRLGADYRISCLTTAALEQLVEQERAGRLGRRISASSVKKRMSTLHLALDICRRRGLLAELPAFPELIAPYRPRQRYLRSFSEYVALYASLARRNIDRADWVALCLWTGQHASDVDSMTWADVACDAETPWMLVRNTKNGRREGLRVRMPVELRRVLRERWGRERPCNLAERIVPPFHTRGHTLRAHCERLGLAVRNAIDLRHTAISWMVRRQGISAAVLAFAGHSSAAMASRVYAHAMPVQLDQAILDLDSIRREKKPANDNTEPRARARKAA